ncbi:MAG: ammonium transporter [Deltaproteobacteria bacterium]|nr:ammonium transporter [Deltaproteobacteria bacterium]
MFKKIFLTILLLAGLLSPAISFGEESVAPDTQAPAVAATVEATAPSAADIGAKLEETITVNKVALDTVWVLVAAFLVFWMNAGFALVESGLCRAKNTVNILSKNFIVFAIASVAFYIIGWGLMFGDGNPFFGVDGLFMLHGADNSPAMGEAYKGVYSSMNWTGVPLYAKFFFQLVFAGTAATIVSGAVAERIKFLSFIAFSFILVAFIYPVVGHWIWGGGWLAKLGMFDFAGSTVVHSVGGWAALAGVMVLGPRLGKFGKNGKINPIPGHNMALATLGALILWLGWFGFNPGSTMAADAGAIARVALTTNMAAAAATLTATATAWLLMGKPDLSMILNGTLAGLVAVTAPCAFISVESSLIIGLIAGVLVVVAVMFFDRVKLDDPVGALSVHLVNGVFGTLALGLFAEDRFMPGIIGDGLFFGSSKLFVSQLAAVVGVGVFTFVVSIIAWYVIKAVLGLRVSEEEEMIGLDIGEHGAEAYHIEPGETYPVVRTEERLKSL